MERNGTRSVSRLATAVALALSASGCIDIHLPKDLTLIPVGTPFVMTGTAALEEGTDGEPCPVWVGENGITYHLFQDPSLDNESFDMVVAAGTTSRLVLAVRTDLTVDCQVGTIAEVHEVLEIVP